MSWKRPGWILLAAMAALLLASPATEARAKKKKKKMQAGTVRVYRFDNLDLEGKVKAPQLMYFLKRIRTRFRSFRLPRQDFSKKIIEDKDADFL